MIRNPLRREIVFAALMVAVTLFSGCLVENGKVRFNFPTNNKKNSNGGNGKKVDPAKRVLRVLIVENGRERASLTSDQRAIINGMKVRDWAKANCSKGPNGEPDFRVFDQEVDASGEAEIWRDTLKRSRPSVPYYYIENEKDGTEGVIGRDFDPDRFLQICEQYRTGK